MRQITWLIWRLFKWSAVVLTAFVFLYFGVSVNVDNYADANASVARHQAYRKNAFSAIGLVLDLRTNVPKYSRRAVTYIPVLSIVGSNGEALSYQTEMVISSIYPRSELLPSWTGRKVELDCSPELKSCRIAGNTQSDADIFWAHYSVFLACMFGLIAICGAFLLFFCVRKFKSYVVSNG